MGGRRGWRQNKENKRIKKDGVDRRRKETVLKYRVSVPDGTYGGNIEKRTR